MKAFPLKAFYSLQTGVNANETERQVLEVDFHWIIAIFTFVSFCCSKKCSKAASCFRFKFQEKHFAYKRFVNLFLLLTFIIIFLKWKITQIRLNYILDMFK